MHMTQPITSPKSPLPIPVEQYFPVALKAVKTLYRTEGSRLSGFDTHLTSEDLASMAIEKVLNANPHTVSEAYIWVAAKHTCFNERSRKNVLESVKPEDNDQDLIIEHRVESDIYDHIEDLQGQLSLKLSNESSAVLALYIEGHTQAEIAKLLSLSATTVQTHINTIKAKIKDL